MNDYETQEYILKPAYLAKGYPICKRVRLTPAQRTIFLKLIL